MQIKDVLDQASEISAAKTAVKVLFPFMSVGQWSAISQGLKGDERSGFVSKLVQMGELVRRMPKTYEQCDKGAQMVAFLHYFAEGSEWFIFEKDVWGGVEQAYGYSILNGDLVNAELGYISIAELVSNGAELDMHFDCKTFEQIQIEKGVYL